MITALMTAFVYYRNLSRKFWPSLVARIYLLSFHKTRFNDSPTFFVKKNIFASSKRKKYFYLAANFFPESLTIKVETINGCGLIFRWIFFCNLTFWAEVFFQFSFSVIRDWKWWFRVTSGTNCKLRLLAAMMSNILASLWDKGKFFEGEKVAK